MQQPDSPVPPDVPMALGAFAVLISAIATLPDHPSLGAVKALAESARAHYFRACEACGITEQTYVGLIHPQHTQLTEEGPQQ